MITSGSALQVDVTFTMMSYASDITKTVSHGHSPPFLPASQRPSHRHRTCRCRAKFRRSSCHCLSGRILLNRRVGDAFQANDDALDVAEDDVHCIITNKSSIIAKQSPCMFVTRKASSVVSSAAVPAAPWSLTIMTVDRFILTSHHMRIEYIFLDQRS